MLTEDEQKQFPLAGSGHIFAHAMHPEGGALCLAVGRLHVCNHPIVNVCREELRKRLRPCPWCLARLRDPRLD